MDAFVEFLRFFFWLVVAAGVGVPFICSLYLLITPTHKISDKWQNFRMSRTKRALKDRHFRHLPKRIRLAKVASLFVLAVCLWMMLMIFQYVSGGNNPY